MRLVARLERRPYAGLKALNQFFISRRRRRVHWAWLLPTAPKKIGGRHDQHIMLTAPRLKVSDVAGNQRVWPTAGGDFEKEQIVWVGQYQRKRFGVGMYTICFAEIQ
jgi:hypothetical protein